MRRVNWSMTMSTQEVRKVNDSQRNKSTLHKLSFICPSKVSQDGPPDPDSGRKCVAKMRRTTSLADDVFIDADTEGQGDLLGNSRAAPTRITPFHLNDGIDEFFGWSFRARPTTVFGGEQHPVFSRDQHVMEMKQSRWPQHDGGTQNACR